VNHSEYLANRHFRCFDGLRAFAVLWVVVYHCAGHVHTGVDFLDRFMKAGDLGVDLFFVISGFLITTLILRERPAPVGHRLKQFYIRRSLRIFPVYYVAIAVFWVATALLASDRLPRYQHFLPSLAFYYSDFAIALDPNPFPVFGHSWSLAVEEKYYLLWPLLVMTLPRRFALAAAVALIAGAIAWRQALAADDPIAATARLYYAFDTRFDAILWGAVLGFALHAERGYAVVASICRPPVFFAAAVALCVYGATTSNGDVLRYVAVPAIATVLLAGLLVRPNVPGAQLLEWGPLAHVGRVSYGIYIFHVFGISIALRALHSTGCDSAVAWALVPSSVLISVAIATLSFRLIEAPFLKLKDRFR
jgi:peptidoglycan/LPS O-acetylase OafA/YrhL